MSIFRELPSADAVEIPGLVPGAETHQEEGVSITTFPSAIKAFELAQQGKLAENEPAEIQQPK